MNFRLKSVQITIFIYFEQYAAYNTLRNGIWITGILKYSQYSPPCTLLQIHPDKLFMFNVFIMPMYRHTSKVNHVYSKRNITLYSSHFSLVTNFEECPLQFSWDWDLTGSSVFMCFGAHFILLKSVSVWFFSTKCS